MREKGKLKINISWLYDLTARKRGSLERVNVIVRGSGYSKRIFPKSDFRLEKWFQVKNQLFSMRNVDGGFAY